MQRYIYELFLKKSFDEEKLLYLLNNHYKYSNYLFEKSNLLQHKYYGNKIFVRGLIEFTNYCKNNCFYCGIRKDNNNLTRYRLCKDEILFCCNEGFNAGIRSFVLQGGEDLSYTVDEIADIVRVIKSAHPGVAITLSFGEHDKRAYKTWFDSGADRYLLRHESANFYHYRMLHPKSMSFKNRMRCLLDLKEIGYQVGTGFMVGSPYQTYENIVEDLKFIYKFKPHMVGIGPYIPHNDTPFKMMKQGSLQLTFILIAIIRLMLPETLIPATTAVASLSKNSIYNAVLAGANVIMPNITPMEVKKQYSIYNNKFYTKMNIREYLLFLKNRMDKIGYKLAFERGDSKIKN